MLVDVGVVRFLIACEQEGIDVLLKLRASYEYIRRDTAGLGAAQTLIEVPVDVHRLQADCDSDRQRTRPPRSLSPQCGEANDFGDPTFTFQQVMSP